MSPSASRSDFRYAEFIGRNYGFVDEEEQEKLRAGRVFVCGVGGMGGACLMSLVRAGLGGVVLADFDVFDVSNLNRQLFATLDTVGRPKVESTVEALRSIHPDLEIRTRGAEWVDHLDEILDDVKIVVNGMDDVRCGISLYRAAARHGATVVDAYTAPLPSVTVVRPTDPRPEDRLGFPTRGRQREELTDGDVAECALREIEYVMTHSSSRRHVHLRYAIEMISGERPRMSFAPMVLTTGNLMAFETVRLLLGRPPGADHRGYFFDPWTVRIERPRSPPVAAVVGFLVRRFLRRQIADAGARAS